MRPVLAVTGSGPLWASRVPAAATRASSPTRRSSGSSRRAVARRYGPVVDRYMIWNEPNQPLWLQPQQECARHRRCSPVAPHLYRELVRAAYPAIHAADPGAQVMIGELAPQRRADARSRNAAAPAGVPARVRLRRRALPAGAHRALPRLPAGAAATASPTTRTRCWPRRRRRAAHRRRARSPTSQARAPLDGVQRAGGLTTPARRRSSPLHLTEFGYQTDAARPLRRRDAGAAVALAAAAAYLAWRDPRVRTLDAVRVARRAVRDRGPGATRVLGLAVGAAVRRRPGQAGAGERSCSPFLADVDARAPRGALLGPGPSGCRRHAVLLQRRLARRRLRDGRAAAAPTAAGRSSRRWRAVAGRLPLRTVDAARRGRRPAAGACRPATCATRLAPSSARGLPRTLGALEAAARRRASRPRRRVGSPRASASSGGQALRRHRRRRPRSRRATRGLGGLAARRRRPSCRRRSTCRSPRRARRRGARSRTFLSGSPLEKIIAHVLGAGDAEVRVAGLADAVDRAAEDRDLDRVLVGLQAPLDLDDDRVHVELQAPAGRAGDEHRAALAQLERLEDLPGDLDLLLGVEGRERDADRVADAVGQQRAEADRALQRARPLRARLGDPEVQRVVDLLAEQPVGGDRVRDRSSTSSRP